MTNKVYTVEEAKAYVAENLDAIMLSYKNYKGIPDWARSPRMEVIWQSGCWLNMMLKCELKAPEQEIRLVVYV